MAQKLCTCNLSLFGLKLNSIRELTGLDKGILIYPSLSNGSFEVSTESDITLKLMNELGQEIRTLKLSEENNHKVKVQDISNGAYFIDGQNEAIKINQKVIIAK